MNFSLNRRLFTRPTGCSPLQNGQCMQLRVGLEQLQHLLIGGGGGDGRRGDEELGGLGSEHGSLAEFRKHRNLRSQKHRSGGAWRRRCRLGVGSARGETLYELDAEIPHHQQIGILLDAFGDHPAAETLGKLQHGLDRLHLLAVEVDAVREIAVELHELGLQFRPEPQARSAVAEIVERDRDADRAQKLYGLRQQAVIVDALMFGDLDDQRPGRHPAPLKRGLKVFASPVGSQPGDGRRGEIHEQQPRAAGVGELRKDDPGRGKFQLAGEPGGAGGRKERRRQVQCRALGPPNQSLMGEDIAAGNVQDGLKDCMQIVGGQQGGNGDDVRFLCEGIHSRRGLIIFTRLASPASGPHASADLQAAWPLTPGQLSRFVVLRIRTKYSGTAGAGNMLHDLCQYCDIPFTHRIIAARTDPRQSCDGAQVPRLTEICGNRRRLHRPISRHPGLCARWEPRPKHRSRRSRRARRRLSWDRRPAQRR